MKLLKILIILFFLSIYTISSAWYKDIDDKTKQIYTKFYSKTKEKYKLDNWLEFLYALEKVINSLSLDWKINKNNEKIISDLQKLNNEKIFDLELELLEKESKQKLTGNNLIKDYKIVSYNPNTIFKENWIWYAYWFSKKYYFEKNTILTKESLIYNWLYWDEILVFFDWNTTSFVKEFKKIKLINDDLVYGFPNKFELLKTIKDNKIMYDLNEDSVDFLSLENKSKELTKWIYKKEEKIKVIYDYILKNISYSENFSMQDYKIFSWIETYKNKDWVCEWYVELFNLMLWFNNISSKILVWDVIDATDFPEIWHAWIKIDDFYYDITFDDPLWANKTKNFTEYDYFKLPKDLFYTNRYDIGNTPEELKWTSIEYRKNLIKTNLSKLTSKYKNNSYNLLKEFKFREKYNLSTNKLINLSDMIEILWYYEMKDFEIKINNEIKHIKNLNYIVLDDSSVEVFLKQIDYKIDDYKILKWIKEDNSIEYIISNNITYHN